MTEFVLNLESNSQATEPVTAVDSQDWQHITRQIAAGDAESFRVYYEHYFPLMYVEVRKLTARDEQTCLDIVQDSMIKAIRSIKPIRSKTKLDAWSRTVVRSVVYDWFRKCCREQARQMEIAGRTDDTIDVDEIENVARLAWIEQQLQNAEPDLRRMIELRYRLGWSLSRIAQKFDMKTGAVDGRIRRMIEKIKLKAEIEFHD